MVSYQQVASLADGPLGPLTPSLVALLLMASAYRPLPKGLHLAAQTIA